jgi:GNAT superfamily N-acetyltransferase
MTNPQPSSSVRRARVEDAGGIARVSVRGWQSAYRGLVPDAYLDALDVEERRERWRERLEGGVCAFVVEQHGIAGYCRIDPPGDVASLYVLPERRRGGVGAALLEEIRVRVVL